MQILLSLSVAILAGLMMTRLFKKIHLPAVTAYLVAGILVGPYCLGQLNIAGLGFTDSKSLDALNLVSEVALGFIAFSIGSEFRLKNLKETGKQAVVIGIFQALLATVSVVLALWILHLLMPDKLTMPMVLTLGAIATATAPAATLMVVREYKAKGELTNLLLPIVALDDAVGLLVFAVLFGISKTVSFGSLDILPIILNPLLEITLSLLLGTVMGLILTEVEKLFNSNTNRLNMTIALVLLTVALTMLKWKVGSVSIGFSSLLTLMMMGTVFCNRCPLSENIMSASDKWTSPVLAAFFVVSGAELELSVFRDWMIVVIGAVYVIFRCIGKYYGARISAKFTHCSESVRKNLGITLFPQAGVALGMCTIAASELGSEGALIRNITLFAILIYELVGPMLTRDALKRAGDITEKSAEVVNRRENLLREAEKK